MKIIVTSDSHGETMELHSAILSHPECEVVVFCGDGDRDIREMRVMFPEKMIISVRGNCDWCCDAPDVQEITLCGKKIFIAHGHTFNVKSGFNNLISYAKSINSDMVFFGHTHNQFASVEGSMLVLNPGSIGHKRQYSIVEIDEKSGKIKAYEFPENKFGTLEI